MAPKLAFCLERPMNTPLQNQFIFHSHEPKLEKLQLGMVARYQVSGSPTVLYSLCITSKPRLGVIQQFLKAVVVMDTSTTAAAAGVSRVELHSLRTCLRTEDVFARLDDAVYSFNEPYPNIQSSSASDMLLCNSLDLP